MVNSKAVMCVNCPVSAGLAGELEKERARVAVLTAALESLLPALELDLRYADPDDDREAFASRVKCVREALRTGPSAPDVHTPKPVCKQCGRSLDARGKCRVPEHNP